MWNAAKVDRLERELGAATGESIQFNDPETDQTVEVLCTYGRFLLGYLNEQLTLPLDERQHAH